MKTTHDQRIYLGTTDSTDLVESFDLYIDNLPNIDSGVDAFISGPSSVPCLKAGEKTLAIVLDESWAEELCQLLETFHKREQKYLDEIASLSDELNALRMLRDSESRLQDDISQRIGV